MDSKQCYSDFGKFIRSARQNKKMSQEEVATKLGISQVYLSYIENGNTGRYVDLALAIKICNILDVNINDFTKYYQ